MKTTRRGFIGAGVVALGMSSGASEQYPRNLTKADIDRWMTELSNWGKWGKDDQAGTVNLITAAKRKAAAGLLREGVSVSMSLDADVPRAGAAGRTTWTLSGKPPAPGASLAAAYVIDNFSVTYHGTTTTHLDALSHLYYNGQFYNGFPTSSFTDRGAGKNDVLPFKNGIFTRGVLFDIPRLKGVPYLADDEAIYPEDLEGWEKKAGFRCESGDAVFVRTGRWARVAAKGPLTLNQIPGLYASCVKWLRERGAAVLGSDAVQDAGPSRIEGANQPVHQLMLYALGTPLMDNCDLEAVSEAAAQRRRWTFLVTINPLRITGATGSPANPIATF